MSHYCVAVFSSQPDSSSFDRLLEPFSETDERYFRFCPARDPEATWRRFLENNPKNKISMEDCLKNYYNMIIKDGVWGYMCNPNAKWDWYTLDGKDYLYEPKIGEKLDEDAFFYRKSQIDFDSSYVQQDKQQAAYFWDHYVEGKPIQEGQVKPQDFYKPAYYLERYGTRERYIRHMTSSAPYAFITPDGIWHAPGDVGWFGVSDEGPESLDRHIEEWQAFLNSPDDPYVSFVDCHI